MAKRSNGFTSHDVRKLHTCVECDELGVEGHVLANRLNIPVILKAGNKRYAHPSCMRVEHLVLLSYSELGEIRLCDVSAKTMETILLTLANRSGNDNTHY